MEIGRNGEALSSSEGRITNATNKALSLAVNLKGKLSESLGRALKNSRNLRKLLNKRRADDQLDPDMECEVACDLEEEEPERVLLDDPKTITLQLGSRAEVVSVEMRRELWLSSIVSRDAEVALFSKLVSQELASNVVDADILKDCHRTYPAYRRFSTEAGRNSLRNVLKAYAAYDPEVAYCQGMNFVAGCLLMFLPTEAHAFAALVTLMEDRGLSGFFGHSMPLLQEQLWQLGRLLPADLAAHMESCGVVPVLYAASWLMTCFAADFPIAFSARVLDALLVDHCDSAMLKVAVSLLKHAEADLMSCRSLEDMLSQLKNVVPSWPEERLDQALQDAFTVPWTRAQQAVLMCKEGQESVAQSMKRVCGQGVHGGSCGGSKPGDAVGRPGLSSRGASLDEPGGRPGTVLVVAANASADNGALLIADTSAGSSSSTPPPTITPLLIPPPPPPAHQCRTGSFIAPIGSGALQTLNLDSTSCTPISIHPLPFHADTLITGGSSARISATDTTAGSGCATPSGAPYNSTSPGASNLAATSATRTTPPSSPPCTGLAEADAIWHHLVGGRPPRPNAAAVLPLDVAGCSSGGLARAQRGSSAGIRGMSRGPSGSGPDFFSLHATGSNPAPGNGLSRTQSIRSRASSDWGQGSGNWVGSEVIVVGGASLSYTAGAGGGHTPVTGRVSEEGGPDGPESHAVVAGDILRVLTQAGVAAAQAGYDPREQLCEEMRVGVGCYLGQDQLGVISGVPNLNPQVHADDDDDDSPRGEHLALWSSLPMRLPNLDQAALHAMANRSTSTRVSLDSHPNYNNTPSTATDTPTLKGRTSGHKHLVPPSPSGHASPPAPVQSVNSVDAVDDPEAARLWQSAGPVLLGGRAQPITLAMALGMESSNSNSTNPQHQSHLLGVTSVPDRCPCGPSIHMSAMSARDASASAESNTSTGEGAPVAGGSPTTSEIIRSLSPNRVSVNSARWSSPLASPMGQAFINGATAMLPPWLHNPDVSSSNSSRPNMASAIPANTTTSGNINKSCNAGTLGGASSSLPMDDLAVPSPRSKLWNLLPRKLQSALSSEDSPQLRAVPGSSNLCVVSDGFTSGGLPREVSGSGVGGGRTGSMLQVAGPSGSFASLDALRGVPPVVGMGSERAEETWCVLDPGEGEGVVDARGEEEGGEGVCGEEGRLRQEEEEEEVLVGDAERACYNRCGLDSDDEACEGGMFCRTETDLGDRWLNANGTVPLGGEEGEDVAVVAGTSAAKSATVVLSTRSSYREEDVERGEEAAGLLLPNGHSRHTTPTTPTATTTADLCPSTSDIQASEAVSDPPSVFASPPAPITASILPLMNQLLHHPPYVHADESTIWQGGFSSVRIPPSKPLVFAAPHRRASLSFDDLAKLNNPLNATSPMEDSTTTAPPDANPTNPTSDTSTLTTADIDTACADKTSGLSAAPAPSNACVGTSRAGRVTRPSLIVNVDSSVSSGFDVLAAAHTPSGLQAGMSLSSLIISEADDEVQHDVQQSHQQQQQWTCHATLRLPLVTRRVVRKGPHHHVSLG